MDPNNQNMPPQLLGIHCNLCGKKAEFLCGKCLDVGYCKPQHQKADWPAHKSKCVSIADKIKNHNRQKYQTRAEIMEMLSQMRFFQASQLANKLLEQQKKFCQNSPSFSNQLQYGASVVLLTRIWIYFKDFNKALDVLNGYLQQKMPFLKAIQNLQIPPEGLSFDIERRNLIQKKLNLISAVASVSHELVRNSMDILEILINHIEVIYGSNSLQLSTVYFYTANYLNFLNQSNKSFACFLKAAKLRGSKCSTSYYNAGIVCLQSKNYSLALDVLLLALNNLSQVERSKHPELQVNLYQAMAVAYKNLNIYNKTVLSLERALCLRQKSKSQNPDNELKYKNLIILLATIKSQSQKIESEIKMYTLPKQKAPTVRNIELSGVNFKNIVQVDKSPLNQDEQNEDWIESFNEFKKRLNIDSKVQQVPFMVGVKLFGKDKQEVVREQQLPSVAKSKDKSYEQKVHVSLELIQRFTSSEMDFLNQLNRLISECKQKSAIIDIFENSNLYQTLSKQKLDMLYRLNPKLMRNTRDVSRNIYLGDSIDEGSEKYSRQYTNNKAITNKKTKIITPRLKLQNLPKNF